MHRRHFNQTQSKPLPIDHLVSGLRDHGKLDFVSYPYVSSSKDSGHGVGRCMPLLQGTCIYVAL
eukprot:7885103-Pyramimonas_sp.AAC.1